MCKSKCLVYSGKDDVHVAVAIFFSASISMLQSPIRVSDQLSDGLIFGRLFQANEKFCTLRYDMNTHTV